MWCMHSIFNVESYFLGSTTARCGNMLWCKPRWVALRYRASYAPYVKRIKRFNNCFDTSSKFPLFRLYHRRSLSQGARRSRRLIPQHKFSFHKHLLTRTRNIDRYGQWTLSVQTQQHGSKPQQNYCGLALNECLIKAILGYVQNRGSGKGLIIVYLTVYETATPDHNGTDVHHMDFIDLALYRA